MMLNRLLNWFLDFFRSPYETVSLDRDIPNIELMDVRKKRKYVVYGGPYFNKPDDIFGIKMAREIPKECDVDIPTEDFSVPSFEDMKNGVDATIDYLTNSSPEVYVGCMGGIGRTGLFMACLIMDFNHRQTGNVLPVDGVVEYIREVYNSHAVETRNQMEFIENYISKVVKEHLTQQIK